VRGASCGRKTWRRTGRVDQHVPDEHDRQHDPQAEQRLDRLGGAGSNLRTVVLVPEVVAVLAQAAIDLGLAFFIVTGVRARSHGRTLARPRREIKSYAGLKPPSWGVSGPMRNHDMVALLAQHTVRPPATSFARAVRTLEAFGDTTAMPCADVEDAAIAFLTYHFTPLLVNIDDDFEAAFEAAGIALRYASAKTQQRFLEEVVLNCVHPRDLMLFVAMVKHVIPAARLDHTLRHYAALGNELHQHNVFWLVHYLDAGASPMLCAIAQQLVARASTNRYLREAAVVALQVARERGAIGR
jgi:hypothetical protein